MSPNLLNRDEYCIFHAPKDQKGVSLDEFNQMIFERINNAKENNTRCNLSGTIFEGDISFIQYTKEYPLPEVTFRYATFSGHADFERAKFSGWADFKGVVFGGAVHFSEATFSGHANFKRATFSGEVHFRRAKFKENAEFRDTYFQKTIDFSQVQFDFTPIFTGKTFSGPVEFRTVLIKERLRLEGVNLKEASFLDTDVRKIDFIHCTWPEKSGYKKLFDEMDDGSTKMDPESKKLFDQLFSGITEKEPEGQKKTHMEKVEGLYRMLKQKCKEEHNEPEASIWHYNEKEIQRRMSSPKEFQWWVLYPYWASSGYGERPLRAFIVLAALVAAAGLTLAALGFKEIPGSDRGVGFVQLLDPFSLDKVWAVVANFFKYITFQRDFFLAPATMFGEFIKAVAQVLIPIQVALFVFALRNKFRR